LTLQLTKGYQTQDISIKAYNDFSNFVFNATIVAEPDDSAESVLIIIIIILCAIVFVFFLFYIFSIAKKRRPAVDEQRESLLTEN
jgi:phosphotransferase system  glucose/maltose/N-acetylglucosamine-specific IIC component